MNASLLILGALLCGTPQESSQPRFTVRLDQPTVEVSPTLYGLFFEEINWAGDGGIYAELVRNRSFEDGATPEHWVVAGDGKVMGEPGARYLQTTATNAKGLLSNRGWGGMGFRRNDRYRLELRFRAPKGKSVSVTLRDDQGHAASRSHSFAGDGQWRDVKLSVTSTRTTTDGRIVISTPSKSKTDIDWVSLFPESAKGVFRRDLLETLSDLKPAFVRFPGGCWVEGDTMATAYRWKATIGSPRDRKTVYNLWRYQSTNGLGYHEYLQLCEELRAAPLFVANCGMSHREVVPMDRMGEFVQDALDAIEYANGPVSSRWGGLRAKHGHPKPFGLKYIQIGNENGGAAYEERYQLMYRAIKERYPEIQVIANDWGGVPKNSPLEIIDEHYYNNPRWFLLNEGRYDNVDRKGPKIYVGEFAVTSGTGEGSIRGAVAEAAFMIGMERNSDVVTMSSYAPLLAHPAGKAWNPDLIYFDASRIVRTPSYHVQRMFAQNRPDRMLAGTMERRPATRDPFSEGGIGIGTWRSQAEFKDIRVTVGGKPIDTSKWVVEKGRWDLLEDNTWRQTSMEEGARLKADAGGAKSYRLELKARKIGGDEGFLITVGQKDSANYLWLNVGGWGNTQDAIEHSVGGAKTTLARRAGRVETGRWYDVAIDFSPDRIQAWLDGEPLLQGVTSQMPTLFANAGRRGAETVVKVVNAANHPQSLELVLEGAGQRFAYDGQVLSSPEPMTQNTFSKPDSVSPKPVPRGTTGRTLNYTAPANSVTILRFKQTS